MPYRNVLISAKQHGAPVPTKPALCSLLPLCLLSLALCLAAVAGLPACLPCPPACRCLRWDSSCTVNCSKAGFQQAPETMDLPPNTTVLDLSYNGIISIDDNLLDNLTSLEKLYLQGNNISILFKEIFAGRRCLSDIDISNNQISTLEDGIFADLFNLTKINLSFNEFVCDCNLSWLPTWMNEEEANGVIIVDSEFIKCAKPSKLKDMSVLNVNFSSLLYGSEFAACSPDRQSLVNLSLMSNWISSTENCTALCFIEGERYAALDNESHCLCGSELAPDSDSICIAGEIDREFIQVCGCTIIEQAFEVTVANFADLRTFSLFEAARLTVKTLVNISTFQWDFGDLSPPFNTTSQTVFHKYSLSGTYLVSVAFCVGSKPTSLHVEINVAIPPGRLELHCPPVVQTNKSIDAEIQNWNTNSVIASWSVTTSNNDTIKDAPICPLGGYQHNNHCYRLVTNSSSWQMARHFCQSDSDGDLAIVKSPEIQNFIANITGCEHSVWIGLSDTAGAGTLQWVDGSTLELFQEWLPGQHNSLLSNTCVLMGANLAGEWRTDLCTTKRNFVCEYKAGEKIPGANYYLLGSPAFSTHLPVKNITVNYSSSTPSGLVELMVFPGLWFNHKGFVSVLELATQDLNHTIQVKFKIYRPRCAGKDMHLVTPDNEEVCSSFAFCLPRTPSNITHGCNSDTKWCSLAETCLPLKRPCGTDVFIKCPNLLPPHFSESHPLYDLVKEVPCTVPAESSTHYVLLLRNERIEVQSNDIIAIQHDGKPGSFLQCQQNDSSPWQQSYYSVVYSGESRGLWINLTDTNWTDGAVCNLRVLYTHRQEINASSPLLRNGQQLPGVYTYQAMVESGPFYSNASCNVQVMAPITDFSVIYPLKQNGVFYVPRNQPVIIVKVKSSEKTLTSWSGSNQNFSCEVTCPSELSSNCEKDDNTCFSRILLTVKDCNLTSIVITAKNKVSSVNKTLAVRAEDPIKGLTILPDPSIRVLSNSLVTYTARVSSGTNVMFKWTVDDKASFIHYNQVYKVIYRTEAVYKLSLIASNHVCNQKIICNVTVDRRNPLAEFNVSAVPAILVRGFSYTFAASVKVDAAVNATFRWGFGDGSYDQVYQFTCPYNLSLSVPQLTAKQAMLQQNVTHIYQKPGEYNLTVSVSDKYDNASQLVPLSVYSYLSNLSINVSSEVLSTRKPAEFEAILLPSPRGVTYSWSFGDNSTELAGDLRRVTHTFGRADRYKVTVQASNVISMISTHRWLEVLDEISGLHIADNSPTELYAPTIVHASAQTGSRLLWVFDMGDGSAPTATSSSVMNHTYSEVGNYTVVVTARNAVSTANATRVVRIFVLHVSRVRPAGCVRQLLDVNFTAYTPGDSAGYIFFWDFGDGSPNQTVPGEPSASHNYTRSGVFPLYLVVSSSVNQVNYYSNVCVQPVISHVTISPSRSFLAARQEGTWRVDVRPDGHYTYLWELEPQLHGREANLSFAEPGLHWVNVTVFNNVSWGDASASVQIQEALTMLQIVVHGAQSLADLVVRRPYTFLAASDGTQVRYNWDFGDGTNSTGNNVSHSYAAAGPFRVRLFASNAVSHGLKEEQVMVKTPLRRLQLTANATVAPVNLSVGFEASLQEGDYTRYSWSFCRCCEATEGSANISHAFTRAGIFNVTVRVENGVSFEQASIQIHVLEEIRGLEMSLGHLVEGCCLAVNQTLWFQAASRFGTEVSYNWTVFREDMVLLTANTTSSQIYLLEAGSYAIVLHASNLLGTVSVNRSVTVLEPVDIVSLWASPEPVAVNKSTSITLIMGSGTEVTYCWALDGIATVSTNLSFISYSFQSPGVKRVNVTASNKLSSQSVTQLIRVQEPVADVTITAGTSANQQYAATNTTVFFQGSTSSGSNISWLWTLPFTVDQQFGPEMNKSFPLPGVYNISLNASNDVSWETASMNFTVQDKIQGLQLEASKWAVAPGQDVIFSVKLSSGTDARFWLSVDNFTMLLNSTNYRYLFSHLGTYEITLKAENQVSCEHTSIEIHVQEPVADLRLVNCNEQAIPAGVMKNFSAAVSSGFQVMYQWHFVLGDYSDIITGQNVSYTPKVQGRLSIFLKAFNNVSGEDITAGILVQNQILKARLTVMPSITAVNETVHLSLAVTPSFSQATFTWKFGDGSQINFANTSVVSHSYLRPGNYLVEVNASNLVSFYVAQATVTILLLKCDPPKVSMILSETMQRSQRNYLEADIDLRGCTEYQVEYLWEIYKTSSCLTLQGVKQVQLPNVDLKRPRLLLPNLVLDIGRYCIVFTISFKGTSYVKITHSSITVIPSALVPIIDGGTYRSWSTKQDLVMDGTKSYDPDQPADSQTPLNYEWLCTYSCLELSGCYISGKGSVFSIFREELKRNTTYTCSLRVSKPGREPQSVKQYISVKGGSSPLVSLECVSCKAQEVYGVSKSSYISLSGSCSNCESSPQYVWKVENSKKQLLTLDNATTSTGSTGMNLVMRHGVLEDGDGYTFSLNVTDPLMENVGFASIYIPPIHLPSGGDCVIFPTENICALTTSVTFTCTGWETTGIPLVYSFILTRCGVGGTHCDEFYVYKGSRSEYSAVLPPGFSSNQFIAYIAVTVQNQQGASVIALNRSVVINITNTPEGFQSFTDWMKLETETKLQELLKQGDPQPTVEYALALVTVLNEYERSKVFEKMWTNDTISRINIRSNITLALTSLEVSTVDDIQQISAALAQCTVISKELICSKCQNQTLFALDNMIAVLQKETGQGKMTPTSIGDNILVTVGGLIDMTNQLVPVMNKVTRPSMYKPELVATKAYDLSMKLMQILMGTRVLNEEPLSVSGARMWAQGKRADPGHLLCFANKSGCQFSIPPSFNSIFSNLSDVTQVMFLVDSNPFPYGYIKNYTISSKVASIEFKTDNGSQIPIESLGSEKAITVSVSTNSAIRNVTVNTTVIAARRSMTVNVTSGNLNEKAGLHIQVTYTVLNDSGAVIASEAEPFILVLLHNSTNPNEQNFKARKKIYLESVKGSDHKLYTFFLSPDTDDTTKNYYLNITNFYTSSSVQVAVGVYTSLCQYFNMTAMSWKTDGILPLEDTTPDMAVCLTQHLTAFGASLFVPPNSVVFINPPSPVIKNYIVLLTCGICFVIYAVSAVIVRKLDLIDINRVGIIPLCGKDGFYKYEILVKTGWGRGSGTSSHVGISLYGREDKSGYRHLENEDAFHRNSVDLFQIATDNSLGNIWKIRVWHDNKGLTPSWYLQHVIIKDLQTNNSYYFLVNDWLAVDNEKNEGLVEKEVLAATEAKLKDFSRIFTGEIQRGFSEGHIWLSIWNRPPRSCFTRVQRVTCCLVLIFLFFCASAVWYGMISDGSKSDVPVSTLVPLSGESVAAGIVSSIIIYPLYLIIVLLFRKARSRVAMHDPGQHESNVLELDDYIDSSTAGSSFLTFADNVEEDYKEKLKSDIITSSLPNWPAYDSMMNWPDLLNDQPMIGSNNSKLRRGRGTRHLGIETQLSSDDEPLSLGFDQVRNKYFSTSDERLIQRINIDENNEVSTSYDSGRVSLDAESHLISNLTEIIDGSKQPRAEAPILDQTNDNGQIIRPSQGIARSSTTRRIAFTDPPQQCLFPFWCSYTAHVLCLLLFSGCLIVSIWIGVNFTSRVALMWLISGIFSVLSSFFLLEPLKVLTEALYFTVVAKRIHPDEDDNLVAKPRVEQTLEKIGKVRPPQGYGLLQAKEEARKVQILHRMLKNFIIYMLFLLVVLLINYGDSFRDAQGRLLHSSIRQSLLGPSKGVEFQKIKRSGELWKWMAEVLLPYLYNNRSRTLLGCPRIRQIRSKINNVQCLQQPSSLPIITQCLQDPGLHDNSDHEAGWKSPITNPSDTWSYSSPDLPGVWYWGQNAVYDSGGYIQKLGRTRDQSNYTLWNLQERNWLDVRTRAIFIEFTQYFQNVDLYSVVTLLLEFPFSGGASTSIDIKPFSLLQLSTGVDFLLIMMIFLMLFVLYFTVTELVLISRRGKSYFLQFWNYLHWCIIILSICCVVLHLKCARIGDKQWAIYRSSPNSFTNFYEMAYLSYVFTSVTATLLFLLTIKAARQLRFIRKWSIFGKTLYNSAKELMVIGATLVGLALVYAQIGYLVFSANLDDFKTFGGSILSLFAVIEKGVCFKQCLFVYPNLCYVYYTSYITIEVWIVLRLFAVVLIQNYKTMKLEMYRPAVEPQDYELVELFVKRLKMWIGISKEKEFRHKVKFEGMVSLPSQSSRDSKSTDLHTASTISDISSSSTSSVSIPVDTFPLVSPNKVTQIEINIHRLVPLFETLLEQFDRVNMATEDVYQIECKLRNVQDRMHQKKINKKAEELFAAYSRIKVRRQGDDLHSSLWNSRGSTRTNNTSGTQDGQQPGNIPLAEDSTKQGLRRKGTHPSRRKSKTSDKKWQRRASDDQTPQSSE